MGLSQERKIDHYTLLSGLLADAAELTILQSVLPDHRDEHILQPLSRKVGQWRAKEEADIALRREYTSLFLLPGGVKPYESVYLGEEPLLMQQPGVDVKEFYRRCGWHLQDSALPEDHASVELSFMAHLLSDGMHTEYWTFFGEHLNLWIPDLMQDIAENCHADFYRSVADYGQAFLRMEQQSCRKEIT